MFSWGRGSSGQLGHGEMVDALYPKPVTFFDGHRYTITHISAGWNHSGFVSGFYYLFSSFRSCCTICFLLLGYYMLFIFLVNE